MKYFYDTEFYENGKTINLISIGIVAEDERQYYAINSDFDFEAIETNKWLMENVVSHLPGEVRWTRKGSSETWTFHRDKTHVTYRPLWLIANEIREFIIEQDRDQVELWADYCAYDHVLLAQLFGPMVKLPSNIPMFTNDLQQLIRVKGIELPKPNRTDEHHALSDALDVKEAWEYLMGRSK